VSAPPSRFAADCRRCVGPILEREIVRLAADIAASESMDDGPTFGEAVTELMVLANRRGATFLPAPVYHDLVEWVSVTLLNETVLADEAHALIRGLLRESSRDKLREAVRDFVNEAVGEFADA
jgi:hypothetical protein